MPVAETRLEILQIHKLLQCVRQADTAQIEKLCEHGVPHLINYSEPNEGDTSLHLAAISNKEEMISFLINQGAHPNVVDLKGRTAAMRAAEFGHVQTLELLAKAGTDMKLRDIDGRGILFYCLTPTSRHTKCIDIVLKHEAEYNNVDNRGIPVLLAACEEAQDNENVCLELLRKGADPNSKQESSGKTALMLAASAGSLQVVRAILTRGAEVNAVDKEQTHAVHYAVEKGNFDVLRILAAFGADMTAQTIVANNALHYAAKNGDANCCKFLSQRGCPGHLKNDEGQLPKVIAKENENKEALKECKKAERQSKKSAGGAKPAAEPWAVYLYDWVMEHKERILDRFEKIDQEGDSIISKEDFLETLTTFEAPGEEADLGRLFQLHDKNREDRLNYEDFFKGTKYIPKAYTMAGFEKKEKKKKGKKGKKKKGKTKVAMPICTQGEGPRTERGEPPEHMISRHKTFTDTGRFNRDIPPKHPIQDDSIWYLNPPEKTFMNINESAKVGDLDSLKFAFEHGRHVDTRDKYYKTPLMVACHHGNYEMAKFLLENGAQVNLRDNFKWTPLHHACHSGQLDLVEMLVEREAEINAVTMNLATPLMRAIQTSNPDLVQYLINKGTNLLIENKKGDTAMDIARWWADPRVLDIVQEKFDSIPKPKEKGGGKGKKGAKSAKAKGSGEKRTQSVLPTTPGANLASQSLTEFPPGTADNQPKGRKSDILRVASAMAGGVEHTEDVSYLPLSAWIRQPTTADLIRKKERRRQRFGDGVDFPNFQMPFKEHFMKVSESLGGVSSGDED